MDGNHGVPQIVALNKIVKGKNPRTYFDEDEMNELIDSVRASGVAQPVLLRPLADGSFRIIAGERRVRAGRAVFGDEGEIPALVRDCSDEEEEVLSLVENVDRAQMSAAEEAEAAGRVLHRAKGDKLETAARLGWPVSKLNRRLALLNLTPACREALTTRRISIGHAELLAAVQPEKQDAALAKVIEHDVPVSELKRQVAAMANDLRSACFDKKDCAECRFNSAQQRALFGEAVDEGACTNPPCFQQKTEQKLQALQKELQDEVPRVVLLRSDSGIEPIRLAAEGKFGVGAEQAKACRSCENYGCTVSGVVGSVGAVEKSLCFNAECHTTKVAANMKAMSDAAAAAQAKRTASQGDGAAGEAASGGAAKKATKAGKVAKAKAGPKPSVGVPQKVKDYRVAAWRLMAAKEVFNHPDKALVVLATLGLSGNTRHIDDGKLKEVLAALTKTEELPIMHPLDSIAATVEGHGDLIVLRMVHAMAASAMKNIDERHLRQTLSFLGVKVASHWKLCAELLDLMTKSEIEVLAEEVGIAAALGEKEMKKVMAEKKPEAIKKLLSVPGFGYEGVVPQVMQYQEAASQAVAAEDGSDRQEAGEGTAGGNDEGGDASATAQQQQVAEAA